jgi:hypothetical protein
VVQKYGIPGAALTLISVSVSCSYSAGAAPAAVGTAGLGCAPTGCGFIDPLGGVTLPALIARIINKILPVVGALFLAMFIWGGFLWFSSAGEEKKVGKARQTLVNAVIGIAIVMGAYLLVYNIINAFGKVIGQ